MGLLEAQTHPRGDSADMVGFEDYERVMSEFITLSMFVFSA